MPKARKPFSVIDSDVGNTEVVEFIDLLNNEDVLRKLKAALYPHALVDKLDKLTQTIAGLTSQLESKVKRITALEEKVERLEGHGENVEQYSRRNNLGVCGIPETGEDTTAKVVKIVNNKMAIIVSHRLGKRNDTGDRHRVVIVLFSKGTVRDGVVRAWSRLRNTNCSTEQTFVNKDLTPRRAALAAATRQMNKTQTNQRLLDLQWQDCGNDFDKHNKSHQHGGGY